jgi:uncharacterized protein (DUF2336 family)
MDTRLQRLIDLAENPAPAERAVLALELCDLLSDWPMKYPSEMREPFETLLEKCVREVDAGTRARVAVRIAAREEAPVPLLNELFFDAPAEAKSEIVRRNAEANGHDEGAAADEASVIAAARTAHGETFPADFARLLGIEPVTAKRILSEPSGDALAIACKGAHLTRAAFSTLAVLFAPDPQAADQRLAAYEAVPQDGASGMLRFWRNEAA